MISVLAVYENGVLRPKEPLDLKEGQEVRVQAYPLPPQLSLRPMTPEEEEFDRRLKAAKTPAEFLAIMESIPLAPEEKDFDLAEAINESRQLTGFRVPEPQSGDEGTT